MENEKNNKTIGFNGKELNALTCNVALIFFGFLGFFKTMLNMHYPAWDYYTQLSNYFGLFATIIYTFYFLKRKPIPKWSSLLKYSATLSMSVTFLVVVFILCPMFGMESLFWMLFSGANLFYHTLCPIIMFISFIFFEKHDIKGFKDNFRAIYFTIAYAVVFIILNILKVYDGPYPFLQVYNQPIYMSVIWFIVIVGGAFGLGKLIMWIKNKQENKIEQ